MAAWCRVCCGGVTSKEFSRQSVLFLSPQIADSTAASPGARALRACHDPVSRDTNVTNVHAIDGVRGVMTWPLPGATTCGCEALAWERADAKQGDGGVMTRTRPAPPR
jgi:hypothetical protein